MQDGGLKRNFVESRWLLLLLIVASALATFHIYGNHLNALPIRSDGFGYYAYLPSVFIDHDLSLSSARNNIPFGQLHNYGILLSPKTGRYIDKYAIGTAVLQAPFFLVAHALSGPLGFSPNGYSTPYQVANVASAVFYLCLGVYFLYSSCRVLHSRLISTASCVLIVFATNVFHYATYDASFSHIYQFFLSSLCLWLGMSYRTAINRQQLLICIAFGLVVGMITLTRLTDAIMIIFPFVMICGDWIDNRDTKKLILQIGIVGSLACIITFPQLCYLKHVTGRWTINAYAATEEAGNFSWLHPEINNFLFSLRKGAFFWSPILLASLLELFWVMRQRQLRWLSIGSATVITLQIYICSSWYFWAFGGSYGSRPMVDIAPLFVIPLSLLISRLAKTRLETLWLTTAATLRFVNIVLMYSYWHQYIPFDGTNLDILLRLPNKLLGTTGTQ